MPEVHVDTYVYVDLDDFATDDLIDELERRGKGLGIVDNNSTELVEQIYQKRRLGQNFDKELDDLIYTVAGRIV